MFYIIYISIAYIYLQCVHTIEIRENTILNKHIQSNIVTNVLVEKGTSGQRFIYFTKLIKLRKLKIKGKITERENIFFFQ